MRLDRGLGWASVAGRLALLAFASTFLLGTAAASGAGVTVAPAPEAAAALVQGLAASSAEGAEAEGEDADGAREGGEDDDNRDDEGGGDGEYGGAGGSAGADEDIQNALGEIDAGKERPNVRDPQPFENDGRGGTQKLPETGIDGKPITYTEHTVNPRPPGVSLDGKRIVTGSDGSAWGTLDHFRSFERLR